MDKVKVGIIILHWSSIKDTEELLESLSKVKNPAHNIYIIDQRGDFPSAKHPSIKYHKTAENLGFSGGNNLGISSALNDGCTHVLLVNDDTTVDPDFLSKMLPVIESNERIAATGPTISYYDHPKKIWYGGGSSNNFVAEVHHENVGMDVSGLKDKPPRKVKFITGCSILLKASVVNKIGPLSDDYFLYWEDADWCARAIEAGYSLWYVPEARVKHKVSSSLGVNSPTYIYYILRNNLLYIRKHTPWYSRPLAWTVFLWRLLKEVLKIVLVYRKDYRKYFSSIWSAITDNANRKYGIR